MYYVYESQGGSQLSAPPPQNETVFAVVYSSHNIHVELIIVLFSVVYVSPVVDTQVGRQVQIHRLAVYESLKEYLKGELSVAYFNAFFDFNICCVFSGVCQLYSEQRAMRMKRIVDRKRMYAVLALSSPSLSLSLSLSSPPPPILPSFPFLSTVLLLTIFSFFLPQFSFATRGTQEVALTRRTSFP